MSDGIKLLSKPSRANICMLICAVITGKSSDKRASSFYLIENEVGERFFIYARDDRDFYRKLREKCWLGCMNPTIPSEL